MELATRYFAARGITEEPRIAQVCHAGFGWADYTEQLATPAVIRRLQQLGYTFVSLRAGGRTADFNILELTEQCGLGTWLTRPDLCSWVTEEALERQRQQMRAARGEY